MNVFYILLGIVVNFIWGLAFLVPYYLKHIDPVLIVLSRYFFYGMFSLVLLLIKESHWHSLTKAHWQKAMLFAFVGNIAYYLAATFAIHYAGIVLPALILGTLPVTMMIYGNMKNKEFPYRRLILPILLILTGIVSLKWFQYSGVALEKSFIQMMMGAGWAIVALVIWTWFGVANANYLKKNLDVSGYTWSLAIGICCLAQVIAIFLLLMVFTKGALLSSIENKEMMYEVIIGGIILGVVVSWLATGWWNKISRHFPTTLAAQLLVFETISSLLFGYIVDQMLPKPIVLACIAVVLLGIFFGIRAHFQPKGRLDSGVGAT